MKTLPFKKLPKTETVDVGNENFGVLTFPKYGCLTITEVDEVNILLQKIEESTPASAFQLEAAMLLINSRIDPEITIEDIKAQADRYGLIQEIYTFFEAEWTRERPSKYLLKVEGKDAESVAKTYAESIQATALTRGDDLTIWYVFSPSEIPEEFQPKGQVEGQEKDQKQIGAQSTGNSA